MSKLVNILKEKPLTLIVSLPENSLDMARAAEDGGADAIKIHMNITHAASGTVFGDFEDEKDSIGEIIKSVKIPVGIVPGDEVLPSEAEMARLKKMGIDFFDLFHNRIPNWMLNMKGIGKVAAFGEDYSIDRLMEIKDLKVDCIEAAVVRKDDYGKDLTVSDLQNYITIAVSSPLPVIVPTQKYIRVSDMPLLWDTGISAIMIGTIVTGNTPQLICDTAKKFKSAINNLVS